MSINHKREARITSLCIAITLLMFVGLVHFLALRTQDAYLSGDTRRIIETVMMGLAIAVLAYGNMLYQVCLVGYYKRRHLHTPAPRHELDAMYEGNAPSLSVLIPAYKEERTVIWQTMMSAALSEYPGKDVVLLIDDPYHPKALEDILKLEDTRRIPGELQAQFDRKLTRFREERNGFQQRLNEGNCYPAIELNRLSLHYERVASWLQERAVEFIGDRDKVMLPYADNFFLERIIYAPAEKHLETAQELRRMMTEDSLPDASFLARHYARLEGLFTVNFTSFERKKYANLSHEANKAMNLNSYMGLMGKSWKEVERNGSLELQEVTADIADFTVPGSDYVNTIDADSLMLSEYVLRLVHIMEQLGNDRLAVIQSPCSSFQGCPDGLERIAGASIDVQFLTHQGYTHWNGSFWVGANALLRRRALEEIKESRIENGHQVWIYIQDRTVIEDTESTIDLVHKGWKLYNYPERMTFSATPPDFGSLLIQRRRWANGGMLILPKLFRYAWNAPKNMALAKEMFMRFHYLASTTTGTIVALLSFFYPFGETVATPWLTLSILPFFFLYTRDLKYAGYKYSDAFRIYAVNLMLMPVILGGVLKSFEQMITGRKIPFGRTPKVTGRTAAPAFYCLIELVLPLVFFTFAFNNAMKGHWTQAAFAMVNASLLTYALVQFIGVREALDDVFAGVKSRVRIMSHKAQIIPLPVLSRRYKSYSDVAASQ